MNRFSQIVTCVVLLVSSFGAAAQDAPPDPACPGAPAPRLIVNAQGVVSPGQANNLRDQPSRNGAKVGEIPAGGQFTVLEGPVCADGFNWWRVDFGGLVGWTVEGQGAEYWTAPGSSDSTSSEQTLPDTAVNPYHNPQYRVTNSLKVDAQARLQSPDGESLVLYTAPDTNSDILAELPAGTIVTLAGEGSGGWWRVISEDGSEGWLTEGFPTAGRRSKYFLSIAPLCPYTEDRIVFVAIDDQFNTDLYTIGADARRMCNLTYGAQLDYDIFAWSPDGSALAYADIPEHEPTYPQDATDLYVISVDGREMRRLTTGVRVRGITWSAHVETPIAFLQSSEERWEESYIYLTDPQGTTMRQLTPEAEHRTSLRWSPDGTRLAFIQSTPFDSSPNSANIIVMNPDTGEETIVFVSDWRAESLSWHPNGKTLLASVYINTGRNVLVEIDLETGEYQVVYDFENRGAVYSPDGTKIAVWDLDQQVPRHLTLIDAETHEVTKLATLPGINGKEISWMLDSAAVLVDSSGILRADVATRLYESLFVGGLKGSTAWYAVPPLPQPGA